MAYECVNASNQYFTIAAPNISVPPVTFSIWIKVSSIIPKNTALFLWRSTIDTGLLFRYISSNWELRYFVRGGSQWQTATGLSVTAGLWQHACVAITSSQARLYLNGTSFTNNASHLTVNVNVAGDLARESIVDPNNTSFNGSVAEAAIWTAALSDAECLALAKRVSPLQIKNHLHDLVLYKDLMRDLNRGIGPTLTAVNGPTIVPHPPLVYPQGRARLKFRPAHFLAPFRSSIATAHANSVVQGGAESAGAAQDATHPIGEVTS